MGKPHSVKDASDYRGFTKEVCKQGGRVERRKRHDMLCHPDGGYVAAPRHRGDYATGTRAAIVKALLALGFTCWALGVFG